MKNPIIKIKRIFKKIIQGVIEQIGNYLYEYFNKKINRPDHPGGALSRYEIRSRIDYYLFLFRIIGFSLLIILVIYLINLFF